MLWICSLLPKDHKKVIIGSAWLRTLIWVKWNKRFYRKIGPIWLCNESRMESRTSMIMYEPTSKSSEEPSWLKLNTASTLFNPKSCPVHFMLKIVFDFERISMGIALFKAAAGLIGLMILFSPLNLTPFSIILGSDIQQVILCQRHSLFDQLAQNMTKIFVWDLPGFT